jgi:predicted nucleotidyltransferase
MSILPETLSVAARAGRLETYAAEQGVAVLFAAESGSRAWGFASADSDYDVRFVYARPIRAYLSVRPPRDTLTYLVDGDPFDAAGWDLFKALRLFQRGNGALSEWLYSPIVYADRDGFGAHLRWLLTLSLPARSLGHHYLALACAQRAAVTAAAPASRKRTLYALRPLFCARWIETHGTPPPTPLADTVAGIELTEAVRGALDVLVAAKRAASAESASAPVDAALAAFVADECERLEAAVPTWPQPRIDDAALDALAWEILKA